MKIRTPEEAMLDIVKICANLLDKIKVLQKENKEQNERIEKLEQTLSILNIFKEE